MANENNLKPLNTRTKKEQREIAKKGGQKSVQVRKARKTLKEELLLLLSQGNTQEKVSVALLKEAIEGNTKAFEVIRDTIGEKPVEKAEVKTEVTTVNVTIEDDKE